MNGSEDTETELTAALILVLLEERAAFCNLSTLTPPKLTSRILLGPWGGVILSGPLPAPSSRESAIQGEEVANLE